MPGQGQLPHPNRRRTNPPTIPTTVLPATGRRGHSPKVPPFITLGKVGRAYWQWAWHTPQAAAWADGHEATVARRAELEELWTETKGDRLLAEMRQLDDRLGLNPKAMAQLRWTIEQPEAEADKPADVAVADRWRRNAA